MLRFDDTSSDDQIAKLHQKEEEDFLQIMASKHGIPYADLYGVPVDTGAVGLIKESVAREALIAPFEISNKKLKVGLFSPTQGNTKEVLASLSERGYTVEQYLVSHASLEAVWERYKEISGATKSEAGMVDITGENMEGLVKKFTSLADVSSALQNTVTEKTARHISNIFSVIMAGAIGIHASDIHIEPAEDAVHIRYRIDGVLHEVATLPSDIYRLFSSRLKLLAGLKLNVGTESQDGRFSIKIADMEIEMRVSVIPGSYGEGVVMRILNPQSLNVTLEDLGMSPRLLSIVDREIRKPHGMILNTGPTGSGKTTTLYSFLKRIYSSEIKMMTIEDPIEYHLKGVSQTQVEAERGYTFLEGLRAA
ncbi:MAG: ATPase, T2SS/T4P/T4SS family, partial [Minisyncoccia bacterium]